MAQQTPIPTRSNMKFSDQRFAAGHESSPKNDFSRSSALIQARRALRGAHSLSHLVKKVRMTKAKHSPKAVAKREAITELKGAGLYPAIQALVGNQRQFSFVEIEQLTKALSRDTSLSDWTPVMFGGGLYHGVVVHASYQTIAPALVFKATGNGYVLSSFHFNYASKQD